MTELPGPGNYEATDKFGKRVVGFAFQGKNKEKYNQNPGPGEYERMDDVTRTKIASVRFGSSKRADILSKSMTELPGPGNYEATDKFGKRVVGFAF